MGLLPPAGRANYYKPGDNNAECALCGRVFKATELKKNYKGVYACEECWEPRHDQDRPFNYQDRHQWYRGVTVHQSTNDDSLPEDPDDFTPPWEPPVVIPDGGIMSGPAEAMEWNPYTGKLWVVYNTGVKTRVADVWTVGASAPDMTVNLPNGDGCVSLEFIAGVGSGEMVMGGWDTSLTGSILSICDPWGGSVWGTDGGWPSAIVRFGYLIYEDGSDHGIIFPSGGTSTSGLKYFPYSHLIDTGGPTYLSNNTVTSAVQINHFAATSGFDNAGASNQINVIDFIQDIVRDHVDIPTFDGTSPSVSVVANNKRGFFYAYDIRGSSTGIYAVVPDPLLEPVGVLIGDILNKECMVYNELDDELWFKIGDDFEVYDAWTFVQKPTRVGGAAHITISLNSNIRSMVTPDLKHCFIINDGVFYWIPFRNLE